MHTRFVVVLKVPRINKNDGCWQHLHLNGRQGVNLCICKESTQLGEKVQFAMAAPTAINWTVLFWDMQMQTFHCATVHSLRTTVHLQ